MPEDLDLLQRQNYSEYARKVCLKMCYFMQKVRSMEITQMKTEFVIDDCGNMWLSNASEIRFRWCKWLQNLPIEVKEERASKIEKTASMLNQEFMASELESYLSKHGEALG
jgi:hypothetical protein